MRSHSQKTCHRKPDRAGVGALDRHGKTALVEGLRVAPWEQDKGVTELLQRFRLQLVKRQYLGVKVAQLAREEPLPLRRLEKCHLITKQVRRTRGSAFSRSSRSRPSQAPTFLLYRHYRLGAPMSPALGLPVLTQALLPRGSETASDSQLSNPQPLLPEAEEPRSLDFRESASLQRPTHLSLYSPPSSFLVLPTQLVCLLISASLGDSGAHTLFPWILHTDPAPLLFGGFAPGSTLLPLGTQAFTYPTSLCTPAGPKWEPRGANVRVKMPRGAGLAGPLVARRELACTPCRASF